MLDLSPEFASLAPAAADVQIVDNYASFLALKSDWKALEARDPEATVFLSWQWLDRIVREAPGRWRIFVARSENGAALAILPVVLTAQWNDASGRLQTTLVSAGRASDAAYTGLLADAEAEMIALPALARALAAQPWAEFSMPQEISPARARRFASCFPAANFDIREVKETESHHCAPVAKLALPYSFETWLQTRVAPDLAHRLRRLHRSRIETGAFRITIADRTSFDRDAGIALATQAAGWQAAHGPDGARRKTEHLRSVLATALDANALLLTVLWKGNAPLAVCAQVLDREMGRVHTLIGADRADCPAAVGLLFRAEAIRWAIDHGFQSYEFGPGDTCDSTALGARQTHPCALLVTRRSADEPEILDPANAGSSLRILSSLLAEGRVGAARAATDQLARLVG